MTKEEAKEWLNTLHYDYNTCEETQDVAEAIRIAIQALEQQPTKEEKALLQKWRDNRGISMKDFEDAMDALEKEPCKDAISREDALDILEDYDYDRDRHKENAFADARARMVALPSVTPIRPKGKWIEIVDEESAYSKTWHYECSECGKNNTCFSGNPNFCPNCGADMRGEKE